MTMHHIATQTTNNNSTNLITFSNIPQTFTHLQFRVTTALWTASGSGPTAYYLINANGSNFSRNHQLYGEGTTAVSTTDSNMPVAYTQYSQSLSNWSSSIIDILDYTNTSKNKTVRSLSGWDANGSGALGYMSLLWLNTAAITSIVFGGGGANFGTGTRFDLYGVIENPIATGA